MKIAAAIALGMSILATIVFMLLVAQHDPSNLAGVIGSHVETLLALAIGSLCLLFIHELGHVVVGKALGLEIIGLAVGHFVVNPLSKRHPKVIGLVAGVGGMIVFEARDEEIEHCRTSRWILMAAAGPGASLLLGVLLIVIAVRPGWPETHLILLFLGGISCIMGAATAIPLTAWGELNDGCRVATWLRDREELLETLRAARLGRIIFSSMLPRDYPSEAIQEADLIVAKWLRQGPESPPHRPPHHRSGIALRPLCRPEPDLDGQQSRCDHLGKSPNPVPESAGTCSKY